MAQNDNMLPTPPRSRKVTPLSLLYILLSTLNLIFGLIMCIASIGMGIDGEEFWLIFFLFVIGSLMVSGGVAFMALFNSQVNGPRIEAGQSAAPRMMAGPELLMQQGAALAKKGPAGQLPSAQVQEAQPQAQPQPSAPLPAATTGTPAQLEEVANLVMRSGDVLAALKDLVNHAQSGGSTPHRHLASMVAASGLMDWRDSPRSEAGRLSRTHHFWIRHNPDDLSDEDYDRMISVEAALNVNQDLGPEGMGLSIEASRPAVLALLRRLIDQEIKPYDLSQSLDAAYPNTPYEQTPGEWLVRSSFSSAAECVVTPFRVVHDHRVCVDNGTIVIKLEAPRPRCMAIFTTNAQERTPLARAYTLRVAALLASQALGCSNKLQVAVVNCHERGSDDTILSVRFTRGLLARIAPILRSDAIDGNGFPTDPDIHASFGPEGWFAPVEPFMTFADEVVSPRSRFIYPELDHRETSERLRAVTGARHYDELGINENAGRLAARDELASHTWESTQEAVSALVEMRNAAEDITVAEACNRVIEALLAGTVDATDRETIFEMFVRGTALERAVARADAALDDEDGTPDPDTAIRVLSEALSPIEAVGAYLDDADTVYRYFGSVAERIRFEQEFDDHRRAVRLVPDAYYNALSSLSIAHGMLDQTDQAMRYADEMIRIAPVSIHAVMRKVRVLENSARIYEAADLIKSVLRYASTPRDASICHYRLAFMEWKLGREDLAVACYQRALTWDADMSEQAREELDDLLNSNSQLHRFSKDEVNSLLAQEGIPLGCDDSDFRRTQTAAVLTCDEGSFWVARPLVGILFSQTGDDVMMGVYRSLTAQRDD